MGDSLRVATVGGPKNRSNASRGELSGTQPPHPPIGNHRSGWSYAPPTLTFFPSPTAYPISHKVPYAVGSSSQAKTQSQLRIASMHLSMMFFLRSGFG